MDGKFIISMSEKYVISMPDLAGNETNKDFSILADRYSTNMLKRGWKLWNGDGMLHAEVASLTVSEFLLVMGFSGNVQYYNPFIVVHENLIDSEIPEGLSNRIYYETDMTDPFNPQQVEKIHTWRSWRSPNHPLPEPLTIDIINYYYFMSATFGDTLSAQELMIIYNTPNITLVDKIPTIENP